MSLKGGLESRMKTPSQANTDVRIGPAQLLRSKLLVSITSGSTFTMAKQAAKPNSSP